MTSKLRWSSRGAAYAAGAAVLLAAGAALDSVYLVALGAVLGALLVVDAAGTALRMPSVSFQVAPSRVDEGSPVRVEVHGRGPHAGQSLRVRLPPSFELEAGTDVWTPGPGDQGHVFEARANVRGPQGVGPLEVRSWSPLRLWALEDKLHDVRMVDVVPRKQDVGDVALASRTLRPVQGRFQINRPGQGFDFFALREYQSSDTMRSVNWKATARRDDLIVNQRQLETQTKLTILLDSRVVAGAGPVGRTPLDRGCRVALGMFTDAVAHRDSVLLVAYGDGLVEPPPSRQDPVVAAASMLARLPAAGTTGAWEAWTQARKEAQASSGPVVVITSTEADPRLVDAVSDMLARSHPVSVLSPAPTDDLTPELRQERRRRRAAVLDQLRNLGAIAVDWEEGKHLASERPEIPGVAA